jgi:NADH-quinone oxidoreductase subunit M
VAWLHWASLFLPGCNSIRPQVRQFGFKYAWVASGGISFAAGIDGISLVLVLLTTFLTPLIILSAFKNEYKNPATFYSLILFMEAALIGVLQQPTRFCSIFSSKLH